MLEILGLTAPLFGLIALGYISGRLRRIPVDGLAWLNFFIVYISLPALFFLLLSRTPFEQFNNAAFLTTTTFVAFAIFMLCFLIARVVRRATIKVSAIQGFCGAYGNIGYLGPPVAIAAFGPEAAVPVALIFCLDNTMHFTLAPMLMSFGGDDKPNKRRLLFEILKKIVTHPFILATIAGMLGAWFQYVPPTPVESILTMLSGAAAPCALFAMGVTAALRPLKRIPIELTYLVPIKLVVYPALMYVLVTTFTDVPDYWLYSAVLLASLPSATNVFVLAQQYDVWVERALSMVVISTLISTVTITVVIYLAKVSG